MYTKELLNNNFSIAIWGSGYLGYYTLIKYSELGISCILIDTKYKTIEQLEQHFKELRKTYWAYDVVVEGELENCSLKTIDNINLKDILVHFLCVPVEKAGKPTYQNLYNVLNKLKDIPILRNNLKPIIILESSFLPGTMEEIVIPALSEAGKSLGKDYLMVVAPRRDWDYNPYVKNVSLGRLIGSHDNKSLLVAKEICELIDDNIVTVENFFEVELARCVENSFQYINMAFANQLSQAFPGCNINKVIQLAATHPELNEYRPTAGIGGFNFPMSSYFLSEASKVPESLTLLNEAMRTDYEMIQIISERVLSQKVSSVLILGLSYRPDSRLHLNSPALRFIELFSDKGIKVGINDPMYSKATLYEITQTQVVDFPEDISSFDAVLVLTAHSKYKKISCSKLKRYLKDTKIVMDTCEVWSRYKLNENGLKYTLLGGDTWE